MEEDQEQQRAYSEVSSRSPSFAARRGWEARRLKREAASRSRSRNKHALEEAMEEELEQASPSPKPKARPVRASVKHEEVEVEEIRTDSPSPVEPFPVPYAPLPNGERHPLDSADVKIIAMNMESIQTMLDALRGRTDDYSMKCRDGLEQDSSSCGYGEPR